MAAGDAAEWLLHAESDLAYAKLGHAQAAILRNQVAFHAEQAPGEIEPITEEEIAQLIQVAEKVVVWARLQICEPPGGRG